MSEISKTVYIISEQLNVPKWEFAFIIKNTDNEQKSPTYSCNSQDRLQNPQCTMY